MVEAFGIPVRLKSPKLRLPSSGGEKKIVAGKNEAVSEKALNLGGWALDTAKSLNIPPDEAHQAAVVFDKAYALFDKDPQVRRTGLRILARAARANNFAQEHEVVKSETETKELGRECLKLAEILRAKGIDFPESITEGIMTEAAKRLVRKLPETKKGETRTFEFSVDRVPQLITDAVNDFAQDGRGTRQSFLVLLTLGSLAAVIAAASGKCHLPNGGTEMVPVSAKTPDPGEATPQMISVDYLVELDRGAFSQALQYFADYPDKVFDTNTAAFEVFSTSYGLTEEDYYWLRKNLKAGDREKEAYIEGKVRKIAGQRIFTPSERETLAEKYQK